MCVLVIAALGGGFVTRERPDNALARSVMAGCRPDPFGRGLRAAGEETPMVRDGY